jgi:hypothetical protein
VARKQAAYNYDVIGEEETKSQADDAGSKLEPRIRLSREPVHYVKGAAMAAVIRIMPRIVPPPKTSRYAIAHLGLRIVANTSKAIAAEPARPWT